MHHEPLAAGVHDQACVGVARRESAISEGGRTAALQELEGFPVYTNVHDKRVDQTSESTTFHYLIDTLVNCNTTQLGTNYNYIRNS